MMHSGTLLNGRLESVVMATMLQWKPVKSHILIEVTVFGHIFLITRDRNTNDAF